MDRFDFWIILVLLLFIASGVQYIGKNVQAIRKKLDEQK
jgi:hypothetical protein